MLCRKRFHLQQMVQIVTRHGFDHNPQRHIAALGMIQWLVEIPGLKSRDQREIPLADRGENGQSRRRITACIGRGPLILIEWLDDMVVLSQRLPQPKRKYRLAIREVTKYVADAPLARGGGIGGLLRAHCVKKLFQLCGSGPSHFQRVAGSHKRCIRIRRHKQ